MASISINSIDAVSDRDFAGKCAVFVSGQSSKYLESVAGGRFAED